MIGDLIRYTCPRCGLVSWVKEADMNKCPHCEKVKP